MKKAYKDTIKKANICIMEDPEGKEKKRGLESLFSKTMAESSPNVGREMDIQAHET